MRLKSPARSPDSLTQSPYLGASSEKNGHSVLSRVSRGSCPSCLLRAWAWCFPAWNDRWKLLSAILPLTLAMSPASLVSEISLSALISGSRVNRFAAELGSSGKFCMMKVSLAFLGLVLESLVFMRQGRMSHLGPPQLAGPGNHLSHLIGTCNHTARLSKTRHCHSLPKEGKTLGPAS